MTKEGLTLFGSKLVPVGITNDTPKIQGQASNLIRLLVALCGTVPSCPMSPCYVTPVIISIGMVIANTSYCLKSSIILEYTSAKFWLSKEKKFAYLTSIASPDRGVEISNVLPAH